MTENVEYYRDQISLARTEIKNLRQHLSALKHEHLKEIQKLKLLLGNLRCNNCSDVAVSVASNHSPPSPVEDPDSLSFRPIGYIETGFQNKRGVPRQPQVMANAKGSVVIDQSVFNNPEHALDGLEEFSHMWIIFHFHMTEGASTPAKVAPPRLGGERRGVFSTRSPHRPCPIGLSLVKIVNIEGNKINFLGVDMVNGTPVLDIKPYIPQYDYPVFHDSMSNIDRPPTEGISDAIEGVANNVAGLQVNATQSASPRSRPPRVNPNTSQAQSNRDEQLQSPGRQNSNRTTPISQLPSSPSSEDLLDGRYNAVSPMRRPDYERGAPDGQERFTPPQSAQMINMNQDGIRVPQWISNPPSQVYEVIFTDDASNRLIELIGERAESFKSNIQNLLSDDPRSQYVRTRYPDHEYSCVLEDLSISCVFDSSSEICTIIAIRSAEDLQS